jgi:hypothetical protein
VWDKKDGKEIYSKITEEHNKEHREDYKIIEKLNVSIIIQDLLETYRKKLLHLQSYLCIRFHKLSCISYNIRKYFSVLFKNPDTKRPLGRPRRRSVDNIKMDLKEIGWDGMDWIDLAQAPVKTVMNLRVP